MTIGELGASAGMSAAHLSKVERGYFPPPGEDKIILLAKALDVEPDELLAAVGRIASDLPLVLLRHPGRFAALLRDLSCCTDEQLQEVQTLARSFQTARPDENPLKKRAAFCAGTGRGSLKKNVRVPKRRT